MRTLQDPSASIMMFSGERSLWQTRFCFMYMSAATSPVICRRATDSLNRQDGRSLSWSIRSPCVSRQGRGGERG